MKSKLTILGVWNIMPLISWPWLSDIARDHFKMLSGYDIRSFTFVKNRLHTQYFLTQDEQKFFHFFKRLDDQKLFVRSIYTDYYRQSKNVERFLQKKHFGKPVSNIRELMQALSTTTMHIWFALLLDIWYPSLNDKRDVKEIAAKARDHSGHIHMAAKKLLGQWIQQLARDSYRAITDLEYLFPEELDSLPVTQQRKKLCVTSSASGSYRIYTGTKASQLLNKYYQPVAVTDHLMGKSAATGSVTGTARVVLLDEHFKDFKAGEILVALQTMVQYVPIMKKAAAILTQYGGLTSHAAIISRELGKPCIVGIQGLTDLIKTGDKIEVDATKGVVRKM